MLLRVSWIPGNRQIPASLPLRKKVCIFLHWAWEKAPENATISSNNLCNFWEGASESGAPFYFILHLHSTWVFQNQVCFKTLLSTEVRCTEASHILFVDLIFNGFYFRLYACGGNYLRQRCWKNAWRQFGSFHLYICLHEPVHPGVHSCRKTIRTNMWSAQNIKAAHLHHDNAQNMCSSWTMYRWSQCYFKSPV